MWLSFYLSFYMRIHFLFQINNLLGLGSQLEKSEAQVS